MACSGRGGSKAQMSFGKILDTISAASASASAPQNSAGKSTGWEGYEKVEKRGLLIIDLNVAPPEDDGSESPKNARNGEKIRPGAVEVVASEEKAISCDGHELNFNGISGEVCKEKSESESGIQAHWSKGESNGFAVLEEQAKRAESEEEKEEKERRNRRWNALLEVADIALCEYEENLRNKEEKEQNRKRGASREIELGDSGGLRKATTRKKVAGRRSQSFGEERNGDGEVAAAAEQEEDMVLAPPLVVRSTRSRAVAMPNKYRDSVLDGAVAEAEFHRHNKSGKSATVVSTKRKSRLVNFLRGSGF
ncbi:hypothetical protein CDL12_16514 [Handroanthus impetiginosus]|uniref:Uncharacterized protein n=1 Tax=Handroanthus impetiginosus TaxID=429701 RepID=A0A2G9H0U2_9LAMI|nr:hypothetical protein CDL12_16514 [Handroanthus impetiginosus]